ncbi:MAG: carboxypeptidase-like regulatory domain-containing protein, partial [Lachnospiraceae bacterium]|nr:carboxypeptidase-like regulatory domain-containing protein [Lachnospiraceae bacterium]
MSKNLHAAQTGAENTDSGELRISVTSSLGQIPIRDATVSISYAGSPGDIIETLSTDNSGLTETVTLPAPPIDLSLEPETEIQPYSEYNITVTASGYEPVEVTGSELLADTVSLQPIRMNPLETTEEEEKLVNIPPHTLWGEYPPKIPEPEIKPIDESGEIVLSRVVVPEYIIVHDGVPSDRSAPNYWVRYTD